MPVSVSDWILYFFMVLLLPAVIAYFCGCFNGAVIVSKYILRDDVRSHGSGNAGLTNFYRTFGGPLTAVVILTDVLKAVVAVLVASALLGGTDFAKYWAGLFCLLGHMFPCMFHFRGGKGILSGGAIAIMIDWRVALVVWGGFLILAIATKYVSLGSCWAGACPRRPCSGIRRCAFHRTAAVGVLPISEGFGTVGNRPLRMRFCRGRSLTGPTALWYPPRSGRSGCSQHGRFRDGWKPSPTEGCVSRSSCVRAARWTAPTGGCVSHPLYFFPN